MLAVYKRELRSYFYTMTGYIFMAFLFVVVGIYFTAFNLSYGYPLFGYTLSSCAFTMLITTPILSMRVLAEERRQKVDQLLLTSPVPLCGIVLGKYLAMITVFAIPIAFFCLYPVILSMYGEIAWAQTYAAILGFYLLGCAFLAVGLYISSITENQVMAAVLSFAVLFVFYLMSGVDSLIPDTSSASFLALTVFLAAACFVIWHMVHTFVIPAVFGVVSEAVMVIFYLVKPQVYEGLLQKILELFNISSRFYDLTEGMLDLAAVVYFRSVITAGVFLTIQSIQKRRWS